MKLQNADVLVEMRGITKEFPGVTALDNVDLTLKCGEIHALLGENGAGKSTMMKILAGMYQPTKGEIFIGGRRVELSTPHDAINNNIGMVYQSFTLSPELTVLENIVLGARIPFLMRAGKLAEKVDTIVGQYGLSVNLNAKVWQLSVGEQQRVEIIKCFYRGAKMLILDEPTAILTPSEIEDLFTMIRRVAEGGCSVVFISHKLNEVMEIADVVSVFRKGKKVAELEKAGATVKTLSQAMVGREVDLEKSYTAHEPGGVALSLGGVSAKGDKGLTALDDVSLEIREGEILGIAAISGNGQAELAEVITGLRPVCGGSVLLDGKTELQKMDVRQVIEAGVSHIPEKRLDRALIPGFSIAQNVISKDYYRAPYSKHGILDQKKAMAEGASLIKKYDIAAPSAETEVRKLSGGNVQKVVLAREIERKPHVMVAVNPTYGLDVGAIEFVQERLIEQREKGTAILLISEELDEVLRLSDRIAVMAKGKIVRVLEKEEFNREEIGILMTGGYDA